MPDRTAQPDPTALRDLAFALRSGQETPTELLERTLARLDGAGNLVAARDDDAARAAARTATDELAAGTWRGPLHGVPVAVKDNIDVAGMPTRCGSAVLADAPDAVADAEAVARLRAAGAVVVAKAHCHEFAYGPTGAVNAAGPAHNPHDPTRITGGSSSGSAALVALGIVPVALGTDTGCSVRTPAALCGVVGLKPHTGAVPATGVVPLSTTLDHVGLLASDVHGAAVAWDVLARGARTDEGGPTGGGIQLPGVSGLRVGLPTGDLLAATDPVVVAAVAAAGETLRRGGAEVVEVDVPDVAELAATYPTIVGAEAYAWHAELLAQRPGDYQEATRERLEAQQGLLAVDYLRALATRARLRESILGLLRRTYGLDALLLAATPLRATPIGVEEVEGRSVRAELLRLGIPFSVLGLAALSVPAPGVDGLPVGLQVVGVKLEERGILRVAAAIAG